MDKKQINLKRVQYIIILFYLAGTIGLLWKPTQFFFIRLIPAALLLNAIILFAFHKPKNIKYDLAAFLLIFLGGLGAEIIGVKTGLLFGNYIYGNSLGFKIYGVPVIIGINWLVLVYAANGWLSRYLKSPLTLMLSTAGALVLYDLLLEIMAPRLAMWYWQNGMATGKNYFDWFLLALIFSTILKAFKVNTRNQLTSTIFLTQFIFFFILTLFNI